MLGAVAESPVGNAANKVANQDTKHALIENGDKEPFSERRSDTVVLQKCNAEVQKRKRYTII